jgi:hypothetical protein
MVEKWLSIIVPSNRPVELENFIQSLKETADFFDEVEVIVLVDDDVNYTEKKSDRIVIHHVRGPILNMSELNYECYKIATGRVIMLANDDTTMRTKGWDTKFKEATKLYSDEIYLVWPNDNMLGATLSCFPIFSKKMAELIEFFPMKYRRYKIDDTLFHVVPQERKLYLNDVLLEHHNDKATEGHQIPTGKLYPIDATAAAIDGAMWDQESMRRTRMKTKIFDYLGEHPTRVLIGVPTMEMARQAVFYDYFNQMFKPIGTVMAFTHGQSPARGRNLIIQQAIENNCSHILFLDDDVLVRPDILTRLIAHDKDIVTGLQFSRNYPHKPYIFDTALEGGKCRMHLLSDGESGLVPIINCGFGCVLIKVEVFKSMEQPWVRLGEYDTDMWCDDIGFFNRARSHGYKLFCDLDVRVGHLATVAIWPNVINGQWLTTYDTFGEGTISSPQLTMANVVSVDA